MASALFALFLLSSSAHASLISFETSGVFTNPTGNTVVTGVNTSSFTTGMGPRDEPLTRLDFSGKQIDTSIDTVFSFGTLTFLNGVSFLGFAAEDVDLSLNFDFANPQSLLSNIVFAIDLIYVSNRLGDTPDEVRATQQQSDTPLFVQDSYEYFLSFEGFESIDDNGIIRDGALVVDERVGAQVNLLGEITRSPINGYTTVNSPSTIGLLLLVFLGMLFQIKMRQHTSR
jgi:hypothetical protein